MNSLNYSFDQLVFNKAKELDMNPKLLQVAINTIAENDYATEQEIIERYRESLLYTLKKEIDMQVQSTDKKARETAVYALADAKEALVDVVRDLNKYDDIDLYAAKGETVKNYHLDVWNTITEELLAIKNKYKKVLGKIDLAGIIKGLCQDEIRQYQEMVVE